MSDGSTDLVRSADRYPIYLFFQKASYWGPIFFLYFSSLLSLSDVLLLEAIYYVGVVTLEVPTGYLADRVGPRRILIASSVSQLLACLAFAASGSFLILATGQVLLALGMSLGSGSDTSYHYSLVKHVGKEDEFPWREGRAARAILISQSTSALFGGLAASADLRFAYILTAGSAAIAALIAYRFADVATTQKDAQSAGRQLLSCLTDAAHPRLAWLLAYFVFMTVVNHIPYEFYQPFLEDQISGKGYNIPTPAVTGIHTALTMAVAAGAAACSVRLSRKLGSSVTLLLAALIQTIIISAMALIHTPTVAILVLLRSVPRGLMTAPLNAETVPLIGEGRRATYLSLQSLLGRLAFGGVLLVFSFVFDGNSIGAPLYRSMQGAVVCLLLLSVVAPLSNQGTRILQS